MFGNLAVVRRIEEGKGGEGSDCLRRNLVICLLHPTPLSPPLGPIFQVFPLLPLVFLFSLLVGNSPTLLFPKKICFFLRLF